MDTLEDTLENNYGIKDPTPEQLLSLKQIFTALDRPEFLAEVPKVSCKSCSVLPFLTLKFMA